MPFTVINGSDWIGDSRNTINLNSIYFDTALNGLSAYDRNPLNTTIATLTSKFYGPISRFYTIEFLDRKSSNTPGGSYDSSSGWVTRTLNTITSSSGFGFTGQGQLAVSNEFTLPAGIWLIRAEVPGYNLGPHQARIHNITDGVYEYGTSVYNRGNRGGTNSSVVIYSIEIPTGTRVFTIQHKGTNNQFNNGLGVACNFDTTEIYTKVICIEIAS